MSDNDETYVDFIQRLADLNQYIVVETIVQHAGYEATVNMLCVSKVGAKVSCNQDNHYHLFHLADVEPYPDGHWAVAASPKTEAQP